MARSKTKITIGYGWNTENTFASVNTLRLNQREQVWSVLRHLGHGCRLNPIAAAPEDLFNGTNEVYVDYTVL